jgi:RNA polymerase sigma factor (sigma-70 family)
MRLSEIGVGGCIPSNSAMNDDVNLIRRYGRDGDEAAFAELMTRHLPLVWGAARRITGDGELARDVAQSVFVDLARKSRTLPEGTAVAGWLHRAACHAAGNLVRSNVRRVRRERLAMSLAGDDGEHTDDRGAEARLVELLESLVDDALLALPDPDREAVLLRYFRGRSHSEVGESLGVGEDAAQKRVSRAVEKLRDHFRAHGIAVGVGTVAAALEVAGAEAVPAWVLQGLAPAGIIATSGAAAGTAGTAAWILTMKTPAFLAITGALGVAALWQSVAVSRLEKANAELGRQIAEVQAANSRSSAAPTVVASDAEVLRLRARVAELTRELKAAKARQAVAAPEPEPEVPADTDVVALMAQYNARLISRVNVGKLLGLAARIYANDHESLPTTLESLSPYLSAGSLPNGIPVDQFEFFPQPRAISEAEPQMILFRERQAEPRPDGSWTRVYVLVDGSVQQISSEERMAEIERVGTAH